MLVGRAPEDEGQVLGWDGQLGDVKASSGMSKLALGRQSQQGSPGAGRMSRYSPAGLAHVCTRDAWCSYAKRGRKKLKKDYRKEGGIMIH